jgi:two-component system, cell cycle response regulator
MPMKPEEVVAACKQLPTIPAVALEVLRLSRDEDVNLRDIADVIGRDVALSGRLLKVVNSAFYGLPRKIGSVNQAVVVLGLASVKTLALGFSLAGNINERGGSGELDCFWRHSLLTAVAARTFAEKRVPILREEAFTTGLLVDIGTLAMREAHGAAYDELFICAGRNHIDVVQQERERFGHDHQAVGRLMAESWQLPELLTIPLANHHYAEGAGDIDPMVVELTRVVHVANICAEVFCGETSQATIDRLRQSAEKYLELPWSECQQMLEGFHKDAEEVGKLLDIKLPETMSFSKIAQEVAEALTQLTLQTQQQAQVIQQENQRNACRLQELEESNRQLAQKVNHDSLTGAYNRRFMEAFLEREIARGTRFRRPVALLFIDIDFFKKINDTYGHQTGDQVLTQVGRILKASVRDADCVCRYGGEEFVVILPETDLWGGTQLAEKIRKLVAEWKFSTDDPSRDLRITVSIGVAAMNPNRPLEKEMLIQMADQSVYTAKNEGRNCVCALRKRVTPLEGSAKQQPTQHA